MAKKPETQFTTSIHKHIPSRLLYRMKNNNPYVGGIPDVWYSGSKTDLWVEYKYIPITTPREQVVPSLSKQQLRWIKDRYGEGRNVWVIVGSKNGGVIFKDLQEMETGITALEYVDRLQSRSALMHSIYEHCTGEVYNAR